MKVKGKTIIVTGGGNGLGRAIVLSLLKMGAKVAAVDINRQSLDETVKLAGELSGKLSVHTINIANKVEVDSLSVQITEKHGPVDGLINNAGIIQPFIPVNELDFDAINRVMDVNFFGTLYMTKAFLPHLIERPEAHLVNVSSMGGFFPVKGQTIYGASKAAVKLLSEGLYAELNRTNVHVTIAFPGSMDTGISKNSGVDIPSMGEKQKNIKALSADRAAEMIIKAMERNRFRIFVGNDSRMLNIIYKWFPKGATKMFARMMDKMMQ